MTASAWTDERVERLKTLWLEGRTAEQIARELKHGISRSAVLGKVHRLGLSAGRPGRAVARKRPAGRPRKAGARRAAGAMAAASDGVSPGSAAGGCDLPSLGLSILTVRRGQCRWPYGEPESGLSFCGRPAVRGAFCAGHAAIGYRTPSGGAASLLALAGLA